MKLIYTPKSHFARKVRILLDAWGETVELVDAGNVAESELGAFGDNPLMTVPTLLDGELAVFDSDHIARYLVDKRGRDDFEVNTGSPALLNARAVMNGAMTAETEVILAGRTGLDVSGARFTKKLDTIGHSLDWLEKHAQLFAGTAYAGFHLVAMWDHLARYGLVALTGWPGLAERAAELSALPYVAASAPP